MYTIKLKDGRSYEGDTITFDRDYSVILSNPTTIHLVRNIESITIPEDIYNLFQIDNTRLESLMPVNTTREESLQFLSDQAQDLNMGYNHCDPTNNWPKSPYGY